MDKELDDAYETLRAIMMSRLNAAWEKVEDGELRADLAAASDTLPVIARALDTFEDALAGNKK